MKLHDFIHLHQRRQLELLHTSGHALGHRAEMGCRLELFALADFYAEVWRLVDEEHVLFVHPFQQPSQLQPWLDALPLPDDWPGSA